MPLALPLREAYWDFRSGHPADLGRFWARLTQSPVDVGGVRIRVHKSFSYGTVRALCSKYYEGPERRLIETEIQRNDTVMEIGGGLGYISTICSLRTDPARVFVYEANPKMEKIIRDTHCLNGVTPHLSMRMVGKERGAATFYVSNNFLVSSLFPSEEASEAITVKVVSFREELERIKPTILIVDIEGGECELLGEFPLPSCRLVMFELHPKILGEGRANQVLTRMTNIGFRMCANKQNTYLFKRQS
jgi:FkbM family methyltransferase